MGPAGFFFKYLISQLSLPAPTKSELKAVILPTLRQVLKRNYGAASALHIHPQVSSVIQHYTVPCGRVCIQGTEPTRNFVTATGFVM